MLPVPKFCLTVTMSPQDTENTIKLGHTHKHTRAHNVIQLGKSPGVFKKYRQLSKQITSCEQSMLTHGEAEISTMTRCLRLVFLCPFLVW